MNEGSLGGFIRGGTLFERIMRVGGLDKKQGFPAEAFCRKPDEKSLEWVRATPMERRA